MLKKLTLFLIPPFVLMSAIGALLEVLVQQQILSSYLTPAPSSVLSALRDNSLELSLATFQTTQGALWGLLFAILLALLTAVLFVRIPFARQAILPVALFFQTMPIVAVAPLLVIWFGFGTPTVLASATLVAFFPLLSNILVGLESYTTEQRELFKQLKASEWQIVISLKLPCAVRGFLTGVKASAGLSVVGALIGEFVAGGGLGALIDSARTQQRVDLVFACILLSSGIGLFIVLLSIALESLILRHRPYYEKH